jgi:CRP-like cAMP-binding protein/voltage-gated potassium channel Kch
VFLQVMRSLYWGMQTLFTVGYGELSPSNYGETSFAIVVMLLGSVLYSYIIANSTSLIDNLDVTTLRFKQKMERIRKLLKGAHLDHLGTVQIEAYYQKLWQHQKGRLTTTITNDMPQFLRYELYNSTYPWVSDMPFFKKFPEGVMNEILGTMKLLFFQKKTIVLQKKTIMENIWIVTRGQMEILYNGTVVEELHIGASVGENIFCGEPAFPGDVRSVKDAEVLILSTHMLDLIVERMCPDSSFYTSMLEKLQLGYRDRKESWASSSSGNRREGETRRESFMSCTSIAVIPQAETEKEETVKMTPWWDLWIIICITFTSIMFPLRIVFFPREGLTVLVTMCIETVLDVFGFVDRLQNRREDRKLWKVSPNDGGSSPNMPHSGRRVTKAALLTGTGLDLENVIRTKNENDSRQRKKHRAFATDVFEVVLLCLSILSFVLAVKGNLSDDGDLLVVSSWLRLPHLWRMLQIFTLVDKIRLYFEDAGVVVDPGLMLCLQLVFIMFFFIHFVACGWQFVLDQGFWFRSLDCANPFEIYESTNCTSLNFDDGSNVYRSDSLESCDLASNAGWSGELVVCPSGVSDDPLMNYWRAFYFTLVTVTTAGYGDIVPQSDLGTAYVVMMILVGATLYTFILASITSIAHDVEITDSDFGHNVEALTLYMQNMNIPHDLQSKCFMICEFAHDNQKCNDEDRVLNEDLPVHLKNLVKEYMLTRVLESCSIFKDSHPAFLNRLVSVLVQDFYPPQEDMWDKKDTDHKMFFLDHGDAELLALDGKHIKKMTVGDTVGELQLFQPEKFVNMLRSMTFCEAHILYKHDFQEVMIDFPDMNKELQERANKLLAADSTVSIVKNLKNTKLSKMMAEESSLMTSGTQKYVVFPPDSKVQFYWDVVTALVVAYLMFVIPIQLAFLHEVDRYGVTHLPVMLAFDCCCDLVFFVDMKLRMQNFGIQSDDGVPILKQSEFGAIYRKGNFRLHLAASLPLDYFVYIFSTNYQYVAALKLNRLMRLRHFILVLQKLDEVTNVKNDAIVKVAKLLFALVYCSHFAGCIYYLISYSKDNGWVAAELVKTWGKDSITDVSLGERYMRSLYWGITTLTMVGYGDITPGLDDFAEVLYTIVVLLIGGVIFAVIISNLEEVVAHADISSILYQRKVEEIKKYLKFRKLPVALQTSILQYYNNLWLQQKAVDTDKILKFLPQSMRLKLMLWQTQPILEKISFIKDWKCFKEVAELLRPQTFLVNEKVFEPEQVSEYLFLLVKGSLRYLSRDLLTNYITFHQGDCVGDFQFFAKKLHPCVCQAIETSHTFKLSHRDFEMLMERDPKYSEDYYNRYSECVQQMSKKTSLASISKNLTKKKVTMFMQVDEVQMDIDKFVCLPQSNFHRGWCLWLLLATLYATFAILYRIAFVADDFSNTDNATLWLPMDVFADLTFLADIILHLRCFAVIDQGILVKKPKDFSRIYMKTWLLWDAISIVPVDYILLGAIDSDENVAIIAWSRANRLVRVLHLTQLFASFEKALEERTIHITTGYKQLVQLLLLVILSVHIIACVRFSILRTEERLEDTDPEDEADATAQYIRSFYYALYTITTVGYGSQSVDSNPQTAFAIMAMVVGTFLCDAGVTATLSNLILNEDIKEGTIRRRSDCLEAFFQRQSISDMIQTRITLYYRYTLTTKRDLNEGRILQWFPEHLRMEVLTHLVLETSQSSVNHPLFRVLSTGMIQSLMTGLKPTVGLPGSVLIHKDHVPINVFIIIRGQAATLNDAGGEERIFSSGIVGNFFGKNRTVKCMTFCDLFALDAASYNQVAAFGSDVGETVESVIADETALKHFEEFAKLTHVSESVHFLQEATEFVRTCSEDPNKIAPMAKNLYNRYICDEAENQINLPGDVHQDIVADLQVGMFKYSLHVPTNLRLCFGPLLLAHPVRCLMSFRINFVR